MMSQTSVSWCLWHQISLAVMKTPGGSRVPGEVASCCAARFSKPEQGRRHPAFGNCSPGDDCRGDCANGRTVTLRILVVCIIFLHQAGDQQQKECLDVLRLFHRYDRVRFGYIPIDVAVFGVSQTSNRMYRACVPTCMTVCVLEAEPPAKTYTTASFAAHGWKGTCPRC